MQKGKFFVIEGADAAGKKMQATMLVENLRKAGLECKLFDFPRYNTPTGKIVAKYLGRGEPSLFPDPTQVDPIIASMYFAADRYDEAPEIRRCIERGIIPVSNRYVESNVCHQASKKKGAERMRVVEKIMELEYGLLGLPKPDAVFALQMPHIVAAELNLNRAGITDGHEQNSAYLRETADLYSELSKKFGWIAVDCAPDGTRASLRTPEDIAKEIYSHVERILEK
ncbi:hypothetical protein JXB27_00945 [Candidatus Woesearchaeota archaeon]|nr:hypothetical protein [Candidatus Woesearchaeota archaeon]